MTSVKENAALVDETRSGVDCKASAEAMSTTVSKTSKKSRE